MKCVYKYNKINPKKRGEKNQSSLFVCKNVCNIPKIHFFSNSNPFVTGSGIQCFVQYPIQPDIDPTPILSV